MLWMAQKRIRQVLKGRRKSIADSKRQLMALAKRCAAAGIAVLS